MIDLDELIYYWKDRLQEHPPIGSLPWREVVTATIAYLQELENLKKGAQMNTSEAKELKLYKVTHRDTGEKYYAVSDNAQDACEQAGWLIGDCFILEQDPRFKPTPEVPPAALYHIPCQTCLYQYTECIKPTNAECPIQHTTPELADYLWQASKAHLCSYIGSSLKKKDYLTHQKWVILQEAINQLAAQPPPTTPISPEPTCYIPQTTP